MFNLLPGGERGISPAAPNVDCWNCDASVSPHHAASAIGQFRGE
jgi:hypothetical protein